MKKDKNKLSSLNKNIISAIITKKWHFKYNPITLLFSTRINFEYLASMKSIFILVSYFLVSIYNCTPINPQNNSIIKSQIDKQWIDQVYKAGIKSVLIYKKGWELSFPIIALNKDDQITLSFDELGTVKGDYSWSIMHCNSTWEQDELQSIEYISGHESVDVSESSFSQNTVTNYINYQIDIPSKDCKILKSGNYIVKVCERNNPENLILTNRFYVFEPLAELYAKVDQLKVNIKEGLNQRVNIEINYDDSEISNPSENIIIKILKNQGFEKTFANLKPSSLYNNTIKFENMAELCFVGGNEYRHFDTKSIKFLSDRLLNIEKDAKGNHVFLTLDENRSVLPYNFKNDINGRKSIKLENNEKSNIMADYCNVYFQLDAEIPLENGDFYIYGAITDWILDKNSKMVYDYNTKKFNAQLFIKQGYYNYLYLFKTEDELFKSEQYMYRIEGNNFQTENDYHILVYYRDIRSGYDKLISYFLASSSYSVD